MRVMLVDDNALFLKGMREALEMEGLDVVAVASSAMEACEQARRYSPEVILLDVQMPGINGIEAIRAIKSVVPLARVVMITVSEDEENLFQAIVAGAHGYLLKNMGGDALIAAVRGMENGSAPLTPGLAQKIMAEFARRSQVAGVQQGAVKAVLTEKQKEILRRTAQGWTYPQIAGSLDLSEVMIRYHMSQIIKALQVDNRAQAIAWGSRNLL